MRIAVLISVLVSIMLSPYALAAKDAASPNAQSENKQDTTTVKKTTVSENVALKSKGTTAKSDSEHPSETPCVEKVIDGIVAIPEDFSNRWHSSVESGHPHWVEVYLPKPEIVGRVVIRFADPVFHPAWFEGFVRPEGSDKWEEVFGIVNYKDTRSFDGTIQPQPITGFRLLIYESANESQPNDAQISEIELYPPNK